MIFIRAGGGGARFPRRLPITEGSSDGHLNQKLGKNLLKSWSNPPGRVLFGPSLAWKDPPAWNDPQALIAFHQTSPETAHRTYNGYFRHEGTFQSWDGPLI